jgi:CO dehydrogenase maturation factor
MKIAFVGKGGSGKSTLSAAFALYVWEKTAKPVVVFDADLNIHVPELLGFPVISTDNHLSHPHASEVIKQWLIGRNNIKDVAAFRKSTPPTRQSNIINVESIQSTPVGPYGLHKDSLSVFVVGTYQQEDIGASCYHNNLAIFENILSHLNDYCGYVITDMVAGVDSFAGTLHAQFDLTCLVVEPTMRSIEVYNKYIELANQAGVASSVLVVGNKIRKKQDEEFIATHVPANKIIGFFGEDEHVRDVDQKSGKLVVSELTDNNQSVLQRILGVVDGLPDVRNERLKKMWQLHTKYVSQKFIVDRFGDLTGQIDLGFSFSHGQKN